MARYQLLRPSPVKIVPRRVRRQNQAASIAPTLEAEEAEGPESPDSPINSPSTIEAAPEDDSESEDEAEGTPSPVESGIIAPPEQPSAPAQSAIPSLPASSVVNSLPAISSATSVQQASPIPSSSSIILSVSSSIPSATPSPPSPSFTLSFTSQGAFAGVPQIISTTSLITSTRPRISTMSASDISSSFARSSSPATTFSATEPSPTPATPAQSETAGQRDPLQKSQPHEERTLITKGAAAAAITLSILGALAIVIAAILCFKRRKRRQNQYNRRLTDDTFDSSNTRALHVPETTHTANTSQIFARASVGAGGSHLTRSTERTDTLFGPGQYTRPETVSTDRNKSRFPIAPPQPTPNPFADPSLNKAYDVLAGRPRSTTLTDRGSWIKNPFKDPESGRFDPFGELQEKARRERKKYIEDSRKQAELAREAELIREFEAKERMGLSVPEGAEKRRKGSGVTIEGLGVLDRSGESGYR